VSAPSADTGPGGQSVGQAAQFYLGLAKAEAGGRFSITAAGTAALGDDAPQRQPWLKLELISAAQAKDVRERSPTDDRTRAMRSQHATLAAAKAAATMRLINAARSPHVNAHSDHLAPDGRLPETVTPTLDTQGEER
jgi:hypothetical protein